MKRIKALAKQKQRRKYRVRRKIRGTTERPRMTICRSHKHLSCQVIDDSAGKTIVSASSFDKELQLSYGGNCGAAQTIGKVVAERALAVGVQQVCLDRGCFRYHGRVAALADAAREAGLKF